MANYWDLPYEEWAAPQIAIAKGIIRYLSCDADLAERLKNWPRDVSIATIEERLWDVMDAGRWLFDRDVKHCHDHNWRFGVIRAHWFLKDGTFTRPPTDAPDAD